MTTPLPARKRVYSAGDASRSLAVAAIVGTILVLVNQGPDAYVLMWTQAPIAARIVANYLIPFTVASMSAALANRAR